MKFVEQVRDCKAGWLWSTPGFRFGVGIQYTDTLTAIRKHALL